MSQTKVSRHRSSMSADLTRAREKRRRGERERNERRRERERERQAERIREMKKGGELMQNRAEEWRREERRGEEGRGSPCLAWKSSKLRRLGPRRPDASLEGLLWRRAALSLCTGA